jgi:hypothetical protein
MNNSMSRDSETLASYSRNEPSKPRNAMEAARIRRRYMNFMYILKRAFNLWLAKKEKQLE